MVEEGKAIDGFSENNGRIVKYSQAAGNMYWNVGLSPLPVYTVYQLTSIVFRYGEGVDKTLVFAFLIYLDASK